MQKRESDFGVLLRHWFKKNPRYSCSIECKQTTTDSIPFNAVEQGQIDWALAISSPKGALVRVIGQSGEPDYIWCCNMPAYIAMRYPKFFCLIGIETFLLEKGRSKRKSLTSERAKEVSVVVVPLK